MSNFKQKYMGGNNGNFLSFNIDSSNLNNEVIFTPSSLTPEETDPIFLASPAANITSTDITNWNNTISPNWNENDSTDEAYIQNRTHYTEIEDDYKWLDNEEFSFTGTTKLKSFKASDAELFEIMTKANGFIENESYTITLNETTYNLQCYTDNDKKGYFIGNSTLAPTTFTFSENHNTEIPFVIYIAKATFSRIGFYRDSNNILNNITLTLTVEGPRRKYNNLNSNYLNGKLIAYGSNNGAEVFNDINNNIASGLYTHAEGNDTTASGAYAHAEGTGTTASGTVTHAEGHHTTASGAGSHAEGYYRTWNLKFTGNANATTYTISAGTDSCPRLINIQNLDRISAVGKTPIAITTDENGRLNSITFSETLDANNAVNTNKAVLIYTKSEGVGSHAEGRTTLAAGDSSHSGGTLSEANGQMAFAHGQGIIANGANQTVFGKYNIVDTTSAFIVGNGTASAFSNAYTLDWNGNGVYTGKLTVGTGPTANMDVATKQYVDTATAGITSNLSGLIDTTITSPSAGQIITYDSTTSKWINSNFTAVSAESDSNVNTMLDGFSLDYTSNTSSPNTWTGGSY